MWSKLDEISKTNESVLIFIESRKVQEKLQDVLWERYNLSSLPEIISGKTPAKKRQEIANRFNEGKGFGMLLLSPKAAGMGLTLIRANHVFHLDRWWNPAVEIQASDRVYRIGQKKPVFVYPMIAEHPTDGKSSFDWNLHELMEVKKSLAENLLAPEVNKSDLNRF